MSRTYGDLGDLYGSHANATYGTLFDEQGNDANAHEQLLARVVLADVQVVVSTAAVCARTASSNVTATIN